MEPNDEEYEKFLQELVNGTVSLDDFIPEDIQTKQDITAISTLVESWNQPSSLTGKKREISEFEDMDPYVKEIMKMWEWRKVSKNSLYDKNLRDFYAKKIYDYIYSIISKFEYIQDAQKALADSKYTKNEWHQIGIAIGLDPSKVFATKVGIIKEIIDLYDDVNLQKRPKLKKNKKAKI